MELKHSLLAAVLALVVGGGIGLSPAYADHGYYRGGSYTDSAIIGAGAGALIGAGLASEGNMKQSAVKGALIGAGSGVGYNFLTQDRVRVDRGHHYGWRKGHPKHKHKWKHHPVFGD